MLRARIEKSNETRKERNANGNGVGKVPFESSAKKPEDTRKLDASEEGLVPELVTVWKDRVCVCKCERGGEKEKRIAEGCLRGRKQQQSLVVDGAK